MTRALVVSIALVAASGAVGAVLRSVIDHAVPHAAGPVAWDIIGVNVLGSLALGIIAGHIEHRAEPRWYPLLGPGLLGGFTTFSTFALETLSLTHQNEYLLAFINVAAKLLLGLAAAWAGFAFGRMFTS